MGPVRFQLNTNAKLRLARLLYRAVKTCRALGGKKGDWVVCGRGGVRWHLELSEGIGLSIYALGGSERATATAISAHLFPGDRPRRRGQRRRSPLADGPKGWDHRTGVCDRAHRLGV